MADTAIDVEQLINERHFPTAPPVTPPVTPAGPRGNLGLATGQSTGPMPGAQPYRPTAIQTTPQAQAQPDFLDDEDEPMVTAQREAAQGQVASHLGNFRDLIKAPTKSIEEHPRFAEYQEAAELFKQMDPKTQRSKRGQLQTMYSRLKSEIDAENKRASSAYTAEQRKALSQADAQGASVTQIPDVDAQINFEDIEKQYQTELAKGSPKERQAVERLRVTTPLATAPKPQLLMWARQVQAMNKQLNLSMPDAFQVVLQMGTPPPRGDRGYNGARGRFAANYKHYRTDVLGNPVVETEIGRLRIPTDTLTQIEQARIKGYNEGLLYDKKLQDQRAEEAKPGFVTRAIEAIIK